MNARFTRKLQTSYEYMTVYLKECFLNRGTYKISSKSQYTQNPYGTYRQAVKEPFEIKKITIGSSSEI